MVKNPPANTGDAGSIPGLGRYFGEIISDTSFKGKTPLKKS